MTQLIFDELNRLQTELLKKSGNGFFSADEEEAEEIAEDIIDELLDLYLLCYAEGTKVSNVMLGEDIEPDTDLMTETIDQKFDGKDFTDRVREYVSAGTVEDIMKVARSDSQRLFGTASYDAAVRGGAGTKTWRTENDNLVRDTHDYINGVTMGMEERFYTFDGDSARYPGDFTSAANNANCRCWLDYSK